MSRLVVVASLKPGTRRRVETLLAGGPPFELGGTQFDRHQVFLTDEEAVFVFEGPEGADTLRLPAEDPTLLVAAQAWRECLAGRPRVAATAFAWERYPPAVSGPSAPRSQE